MLLDAINTTGLTNGILMFGAVVVGSAMASFVLVFLIRRAVLGKKK